MNDRDKIYNACKSIYPGESYKFLKYDQFVKNPFFFTKILDNIETINSLFKLLKNSNLSPITRTPAGCISKHDIHHAGGAWDYRKVTTKTGIFKGVIITVIIKDTVFVFKCGRFQVDKSEMTGVKAFRLFMSQCKKNGIDLNNYKSSEGFKIKNEIESAYIMMFLKHKRLEHVNHLDINNAWCAACCETYPEFIPVFEELRKKDKLIGDMALGYCQSEYCGYSLSSLAKAGINNTNKNVLNLLEKLTLQDFEPVGINTDGIWYYDKRNEGRIYTDTNNGIELGQWKTDHKDCIFYAESDGQYYFIEDGKFHVKARGFYRYEQIKPREEWDEEDFFKAINTSVLITFDDEEGFIII